MTTTTGSIFDLMSSLSETIAIDVTTRPNYGDVRDLYGKLFDIRTASPDGKSVETQRYEYLLCWVFKAMEPVEITAMSFGSRATLAQSYKDQLQATTVETLANSLQIITKLAQTDVSGQPFEMRLLKSATNPNAPLQGVRITTARLILQAFQYITQYAQGKQVVVTTDDSGEPVHVNCFLPEEGDFATDSNNESTGYYARDNASLVNRVYISLSFGNRMRLDGDTKGELREQLIKDALVRTQVIANTNRQGGYSYSTVIPVVDEAVRGFLLQSKIDEQYVVMSASRKLANEAQAQFGQMVARKPQVVVAEKAITPVVEQPAPQPTTEQPAGEATEQATNELDVTDPIARLDGETDADYNARVLEAQLGGN